jgi:RimJ/RimL family protein N-acetyltransferase
MSSYIFRPLTATDSSELIAFHERCSERTHYLRFFCAKPHLRPDEAEYLCAIDQHKRGALVVTSPDSPDAIHGVGRWEPVSDDAAEIAFVIEDTHQGHGIGRALVTAVLEEMQRAGYQKAVADVLAENGCMRALLRQAAETYTERHAGYGAIAYELTLASDCR